LLQSMVHTQHSRTDMKIKQMLTLCLNIMSSQICESQPRVSVVQSLPSLTPAPSLHPSPSPFTIPYRRYRYSPLPSGERLASDGHKLQAIGVGLQAEEYHSLLPSGDTLPAYRSRVPDYNPPQYHSLVLNYNQPNPDYPLKAANYQYKYDTTRVPECAETNQQYYNLTFCLQDQQYPV